LKRKSDGVLHGAVSWAVTTIMFAVLATSIGGTLLSGVFNNMSQLAQANATGGGAPLSALLRATGANIDAATMQQLQQMLQTGQRDQAIQLVTTRMNLDPTHAATLVDQALILSGAPQAASPQSKASTDAAVQRAGTAAWGIFGTVALALAIGIGGGALGAAGSRRVSWSTGTPDRI
jgi:hypothetical protein